jgi:hypothetical protein
MGELRDEITLIAVSSFGEGSPGYPPHTRWELFFMTAAGGMTVLYWHDGHFGI